ncbi:hypothetical protein Mgra_00005187 [Meloidogyne graminicola]|uniref:Secreted protein n=1 Tax=Meloidogyne graminicola TaxID=189291 RepID=A0A8S9ZP90_9BILA|nr:hypothetical protein Mgra_00005187 [Meloidogyne graminicola]
MSNKLTIYFLLFTAFIFIVQTNGEGATYQFENPPEENLGDSSDSPGNSSLEEDVSQMPQHVLSV